VSRNTSPSGFDDRDNWALEMQARFALSIYREYWAISRNEITEVDELGKTETAAKVMDCDGGADKVVTPATGNSICRTEVPNPFTRRRRAVV